MVHYSTKCATVEGPLSLPDIGKMSPPNNRRSRPTSKAPHSVYCLIVGFTCKQTRCQILERDVGGNLKKWNGQRTVKPVFTLNRHTRGKFRFFFCQNGNPIDKFKSIMHLQQILCYISAPDLEGKSLTYLVLSWGLPE